jgi:hypothetical protein
MNYKVFLTICKHLAFFQNVFSLHFSDRKKNELLYENFQLFQTLFYILTIGVPGVPPTGHFYHILSH